jgi:cell division transport system permease protein
METFVRILRLGSINFWRNRWLTLGATLLMTLTLTMISVSLLVSFMIRDTTNAIRDKINLTIYFRDDTVEEAKITSLGNRIKNLPNVESVDYIDKQRALEIFRRLPINENVKQPIDQNYNPLPRSLEINTTNVEQLETLRTDIETSDTEKIICTECVSLAQNKEVVDNLIRSTRAVQQAGWLLSFFFGLIAIFNVYNIIRLAIAARSDEIEIMRYVGASNAFIRGPFIVEGLLYGFLGTVITTLFLPLLVRLLTLSGAGRGISGAFSVLGTDLFSYVVRNLPALVSLQLVIGLGLGVIVSFFSIRRYLRV